MRRARWIAPDASPLATSTSLDREGRLGVGGVGRSHRPGEHGLARLEALAVRLGAGHLGGEPLPRVGAELDAHLETEAHDALDDGLYDPGGPRRAGVRGESGHPDSRHFTDEVERYTTGNLRAVYFYPAQLEGHTERTYRPGR